MSESTASVEKPWSQLGLWLLLLAGCTASASRAAPDPDKVQLSIADRAAYDAAIAKEHGRVVLVDFWASWCEPCVANFPHVIELADRAWDRGLSVVTVNMDAPAAADKTLEFLKSRRAGAARHLISQFGGSSESMEKFEIPNGALPCYKLYDRTGKLRHTFALDPAATRQFTLQEVDSAVEVLLAE